MNENSGKEKTEKGKYISYDGIYKGRIETCKQKL
jgi:hypothetical protein